ncbi:hypothetical protein GLW00_06820 [Halobacillus litoralis]|uniref:Aminoglycoside phosphotransferase domain-containing protein n=1 Tax=Halobacillus litoralis TaxID=45668 RepID=A0A845F8L8_9BACI|nr:hypothetical protein [Halobacillus litoralis]MYL70553.1 hypothetical protein [Halobacillus litoralis]
MEFLTKQSVTEFEQVNRALENEGLNTLSGESDIKRLGEGSWHYAYLVERDQLVLRIPKKVAYEEAVVFNRDQLTAEYGATEAFYKAASQAQKGMCPEFFHYLINEDLTYTLESYMGETLGMEGQTQKQSEQYGREMGDFFRTLEEIDPPYEGIGYLEVAKNGELKGGLDMDLSACIVEERGEYEEELHNLLSSAYEFDKEKVAAVGKELIPNRSIDQEKRILTNQDTSPENLIFTSNGVKMIDPVPLLYTGTSIAANHVFNYRTFFPTVYDTRRYAKGKYHLYANLLKVHADGFVEGYTHGSEQKRMDLHIEVFLKLVTMAHAHLELLQEETLMKEQIIRFGTKEQIEKRLQIYLTELENFQVEVSLGEGSDGF